MEAIPYKLRLQLSDEIPQEGQRRVMARIPAFDAPDMDITFSNESDDGCCHSGCRNPPAEIARAIGMNYAFALEFIGLAGPQDPKG